MSDETTDDKSAAVAGEALGASAVETPPSASAPPPRYSQRPVAAFLPPEEEEGWSDPKASDALEEPAPPTPRSAGVEPPVSGAEDAARPRSVIPLPYGAAPPGRISAIPRPVGTPSGDVLAIPPAGALPAGMDIPSDGGTGGAIDDEDDEHSDGEPTPPRHYSPPPRVTRASEPARSTGADDSDIESDPAEAVRAAARRSEPSPKPNDDDDDDAQPHHPAPIEDAASSSGNQVGLPPTPAFMRPPLMNAEDIGATEEAAKSLKPMRIISIGSASPPQPEKRRGPPPAEALARILRPLNLPIDEAPDIEVEVSIADDDDEESVEEILDPDEAVPFIGGRSKPPPPPPRVRTSESPPARQSDPTEILSADATPIPAAVTPLPADAAPRAKAASIPDLVVAPPRSKAASVPDVGDTPSRPKAASIPDVGAPPPRPKAASTPDVAEAPSRPRAASVPGVEPPLGEDELTPTLAPVDEPAAVSIADVDVAPASEPDVEGIEEVAEPEPEVAKPPPPPKRRPQGSQPAGQELEARKAEAKTRAKPWWEDLFTEDFGRGIAPLTDAQLGREVTFIEDSLGVAKGGIVLDLACGIGQQTVELARRGYSMVGFDLSLPQLALAGELAQARGQKLNFLQGDMREMNFEETFDGIYCWNTSFGYFEEDRNFAVAQKIFKALRSGGSFLLDVINRDFVAAHQPSSVWFEGDGCVCMDDMSVDFITSRLKVKRTIMMDDGRTRECNYSIRVYSLHELGRMLHDIGFRVTEASGHPAYPGVFFGATSPRVIILAQKP